MKVSLAALKEYVEISDPQSIAETLVAAGIEVEAIVDPSARNTGVIVAQVVDVLKHPESDKLWLCRVDDGAHIKEVVCGADNVKTHMKVAYAPPGAQVGAVTLSARLMRGTVSHGMLCSAGELGLGGDKSGLMQLDADRQLGDDALVGADVMFELSVGPNRPDLLGHQGIARELAAAMNQRLRPNKSRVVEKGPDIGVLARVGVDEPSFCKRYQARVVRNVRVGPSPRWLQQRLEMLGLRAINNVVDIANWVMLDLGQPLHTFDLARIAIDANLPMLKVRRANDHERLRCLDGQERTLSTQDMVVADSVRPIALAGVMGGTDTEVGPATSTVLLEAAWFEPRLVRHMAKRHGLRTEAALRFERGADPLMGPRALERACQLLMELANAEVARGTLEVASRPEPKIEIALRPARIQRILGVSVPQEAIVSLLEPLELRCGALTEQALRFEVPSFRPDLHREIDLIEEVARRMGLNNLPSTMPSAAMPFAARKKEIRIGDTAREALLTEGFDEAITFGFVGPSAVAPMNSERADQDTWLRLINPLGEEYSVMRPTLLPGLLRVAQNNIRHEMRDLRVFEVGSCFEKRAQAFVRPQTPALEATWVAGALLGGRDGGRWYEGQGVSGQMDVTDAIGAVEAIVQAYNLDASYEIDPTTRAPYLNPQAAGDIVLRTGHAKENSVVLGHVGALSAGVAEHLGLPRALCVFELNLSLIGTRPQRRALFQPWSKFPGTRRDIALVVARDIKSEVLRRFIFAHAGEGLKDAEVKHVQLFDRFEHGSLGPDKISLAFAIFYQGAQRTLTDAEVNQSFLRLQKVLPEAFDATVRNG